MDQSQKKGGGRVIFFAYFHTSNAIEPKILNCYVVGRPFEKKHQHFLVCSNTALMAKMGRALSGAPVSHRWHTMFKR